jgi:hypothetical protein
MRPSGRKVLIFTILSIAYFCLAAFIFVMASIRTCSMQPDVAALCDPSPIILVLSIVAALCPVGAYFFFKAKISGVD